MFYFYRNLSPRIFNLGSEASANKLYIYRLCTYIVFILQIKIKSIQLLNCLKIAGTHVTLTFYMISSETSILILLPFLTVAKRALGTRKVINWSVAVIYSNHGLLKLNMCRIYLFTIHSSWHISNCCFSA